MWIEVLKNDEILLDEFVDIWNARAGCTVFAKKEVIRDILEKKTDAHCYIFKGVHVTYIIIWKHDRSDDTTYLIYINSNLTINDTMNSEKNAESWVAMIELVTMLLNRYPDRKVKFMMFEEKWTSNAIYQEFVRDHIVESYAKGNILCTKVPDFWMLEWM